MWINEICIEDYFITRLVMQFTWQAFFIYYHLVIQDLEENISTGWPHLP